MRPLAGRQVSGWAGAAPGVAVPEAAAQVYVHLPVDAALSISDTGCELDDHPLRPRPRHHHDHHLDSPWAYSPFPGEPPVVPPP
ncbi:hypothetical protein [Prauserella aidingensis]|uniref:hypothetical protein n=1 Tax=Prauserella aidingensis TaxID=387890 RepID=UPI0020A5BC90|nr:hypothetical protein [Prauserella aidingensis]